MEQTQLIMYRKSLQDIPAVLLPKGYSIRPYQDGDEQSLAPVDRKSVV